MSGRFPAAGWHLDRAKDRPARWLTASLFSLAVLAAASAAVSYAAQYRMVFAAKGVAPVAALEAAIPDVAALIFATLGIALALHGRRAIRARVLNVAAVVDVGGDERAGRRARVARSGDLGDAAGRVRAGFGHGDRRGPGLGPRPAEGD